MKKTLEGASIIIQPRQPLPGILKLGLDGGGVFPEGEEFHLSLRPATGTANLGENHE